MQYKSLVITDRVEDRFGTLLGGRVKRKEEATIEEEVEE